MLQSSSSSNLANNELFRQTQKFCAWWTGSPHYPKIWPLIILTKNSCFYNFHSVFGDFGLKIKLLGIFVEVTLFMDVFPIIVAFFRNSFQGCFSFLWTMSYMKLAGQHVGIYLWWESFGFIYLDTLLIDVNCYHNTVKPVYNDHFWDH